MVQLYIKFSSVFLRCLVVIIFLSTQTKAQHNNKRFENISVKDGLPENSVLAISQDTLGFMWFGTWNGLVRYDGRKLKNYNFEKNNPYSFKGGAINSLFHDKEGTFWICGQKGLNYYDMASGKFYNYIPDSIDATKDDFGLNFLFEYPNGDFLFTHNQSFFLFKKETKKFEALSVEGKLGSGSTFKPIWGMNRYPMLEDKEGRVWIAHSNGLSFYHSKTKTYAKFKDVRSDTKINMLCIGNDSTLLAGTIGAGVLKINLKTMSVSDRITKDETLNYSLSSDTVYDIHKDKRNRLWFFTAAGIDLYDRNSKTFVNYKHGIGFPVFQYEDEDGNFWVKIYTAVNRFHPGYFVPSKKKCYHFQRNEDKKDGFKGYTFMSFYHDKSDVFWFGTYGQGVFKYASLFDKFIIKDNNSGFPTTNNEFATIYYEDNAENQWIGTFSDVWQMLPDKKRTVVKNPIKNLSNNRVWKILNDAKGNYWFGTQKGLNFSHGSGKNACLFEHASDSSNLLTKRRIANIFECSNGEIWISITRLGIVKLIPKVKNPSVSADYNFVHFSPDLIGARRIYEIFEFKNTIWMTSQGQGLIRYNPDNEAFEKHINREERFDYLTRTAIDSKNRCWVGSLYGGIHLFDLEKQKLKKTYTFRNGLPNNWVWDIVIDNNDKIWLTTPIGLSSFNPDNETFTNYTYLDGLHSMTASNYNGVMANRHGDIFYGGAEGYNFFSPDSLLKDNIIPIVRLTSFQLFEKEVTPDTENSPLTKVIELTDNISLQYDENSVIFEFSAMHYVNSKKIQYSYILEGFEKEWHNVDNRNIAFYTGLPSGNYVFRVKAANTDGVWNDHCTEVKFVIHTPWWEKEWVRFVGLLLIISLFGLFVKIREGRLRKYQQVLEVKVEERTTEIKQQNKILNKKNTEISDSINYASRIQSAALPDKQMFSKHFDSFFIFWRPRNVVSGDFYWFKDVKIGDRNFLIFAAADCTGHGVPGAFVSMLGISMLNDIVKTPSIWFQKNYAAKILDNLRDRIKIALKHDENQSKDGMDIALCIIEQETNILHFSGARNPLYLLRGHERELEDLSQKVNVNEKNHYNLFEVRADAQPIGAHYKEKPFTNSVIQLYKGDKIYIFSDGIVDQCGGAIGRKFMKSKLKELLLDTHQNPMNEQQEHIVKAFTDWKNDYPQVDDILLIGVKI